jgi:hypothetical protein
MTCPALEIEATLSHLNPKVSICLAVNGDLTYSQITSLSQHTGSHIWYGIVQNKVTDNFTPRSLAPPQVKDACIALFKHTPYEIVLKVDAYITAGLPNVLGMSNSTWPTKIKSKICNLMLKGLCD